MGTTCKELQRSLDFMVRAYERTGLCINADKTEVMVQSENHPANARLIVNGNELQNISRFKYLGSIFSDECGLDDEVQRRIGSSTASFGRLSKSVFYNRDLRLTTKIKVHQAICLSVLLNGCETWAQTGSMSRYWRVFICIAYSA